MQTITLWTSGVFSTTTMCSPSTPPYPSSAIAALPSPSRRAWVDPDYRARLLGDGSAAIAELGYGGVEGEHMVVVENTPDVHNVIVCTLCSCYPWPVLGLPPSWYKSEAYRARVVAEPRGVLAEFGLDLDPDVDLRVWDSSAEVRYLVLPERPEGTDGLSEEQLAGLVTRDSMIGVARAEAPA